LDSEAVVASRANTSESAQERFAAALQHATRLGMAALVVTFVPYMAGWMPSRIAPEALPALWTRPLRAFLERAQTGTGWQWTASLDFGDSACLIGIAILCAASAVALLAALGVFWRGRDRISAALCLVQIGVLVVAASDAWSR